MIGHVLPTLVLALRLKIIGPRASAAFWIVRSHSRGLLTYERTLLESWRARDRHERVYQQMCRLWDDTQGPASPPARSGTSGEPC